MLTSVRTVSAGISDIFEQLMHIGEGDVFIGISFPRYSNRTIEGMAFARSRGCLLYTSKIKSQYFHYLSLQNYFAGRRPVISLN